MNQTTIDHFVATYYETKDKVTPKHYPDWIVAIDAALYKGDHTDFNAHFKHYQPVMDEIVKRERESQRRVSQHGLMIFWLFSPDYRSYPEIEDIETEQCFDCRNYFEEDLLINHADKRMGDILVCEECLKDIIWQEKQDAENN